VFESASTCVVLRFPVVLTSSLTTLLVLLQPQNRDTSVADMPGMFAFTASFNQPLADWNVSSVKDMFVMFGGATSFNQPLADWNVSSVTEMTGMFGGATSFNQPLGNWDVSSDKDLGDIRYDSCLDRSTVRTNSQSYPSRRIPYLNYPLLPEQWSAVNARRRYLARELWPTFGIQ
jgi:surface protein